MASHASRFTASLAALTSGALAVVFALTLDPRTASWIVLGLGSLTIVSVLAAFAMPDQGAASRVVQVLLFLVGAWTIASTRVFSGPELIRWLCFAGGAALAGLGALALILHERHLEGRMRRMIEAGAHPIALAPRTGTSETPLQRARA